MENSDSGRPRACVIYSYPSLSSAHGSRLLEAVKSTLEQDKADYALIDLYRANFNPILSEEEEAQYGKKTSPDAAYHQTLLKQANVWIFIYPVWWSTPPAILKGFLDRVLTPGFAFKFDEKGAVPLLAGKRALSIRTYSSSAAHEQEVGSVSSNFMENAVLEFCGMKANSVDIFSVGRLAPTAFAHTLKQIPGAVRRVLITPTAVPHHLRSLPAPYLPPIEEQKKKDEGEKPILSKAAEDDLNYFKQARMSARRAIQNKKTDYGKPDVFQGGSGRSRGFEGSKRHNRRDKEFVYTGRQGNNENYAKGRSEGYGRQSNSDNVYAKGRSEGYGRHGNESYARQGRSGNENYTKGKSEGFAKRRPEGKSGFSGGWHGGKKTHKQNKFRQNDSRHQRRR